MINAHLDNLARPGTFGKTAKGITDTEWTTRNNTTRAPSAEIVDVLQHFDRNKDHDIQQTWKH